MEKEVIGRIRSIDDDGVVIAIIDDNDGEEYYHIKLNNKLFKGKDVKCGDLVVLNIFVGE